ncbi:AAA family ATPase [Segatella hominis]|uniref:AAA family ATPase n=1 Tax=Segatella hominis TaxID=2518605 RepID=UPI003AB97791
MIAEFKIRNFYSLRDEQTLSFIPTNDDTSRDIYTEEVADGVSLLKIGCIYGSNASGKTNILKALDFFSQFMVNDGLNKGDEIGVVPFLLDDVSGKERTQFEMSFYLNREKYKLNLVLDNKVIYEETLQVYSSVQPTLLYKRTYNPEKDATDIVFGGKVGLVKKSREAIEGNTFNKRTVIAAFGMSNVEKSRLNLVYDFFSQKIAPIMYPQSSLMGFTKRRITRDRDGRLKRFILHFLKASDFNISDIAIHEEEVSITPEMELVIKNTSAMPEKAKEEILKKGTLHSDEMFFVHHTSKGDKELDEELESRGTKRYMGLATILYDLLVHGVILPIDEIESSIHYELLSYFIKVFLVNSKRSGQLIISTHDINLLDEDYIRRDVIWFTDKNDCGETQLIRLSTLGLHKTLSVYNAYRQEKLVNLPFLDSIYMDMDEYYEHETGE